MTNWYSYVVHISKWQTWPLKRCAQRLTWKNDLLYQECQKNKSEFHKILIKKCMKNSLHKRTDLNSEYAGNHFLINGSIIYLMSFCGS